MTQKMEDLRTRRTRKMLREALIQLTIERGFADVTVRDITERAMVNRSTFYRHYLDKYDLLHQYIEELIEMLYSQEESFVDKPNQSLHQPSAGIVRILKHIQMNADFYRALLGKKGDPTFCAQLFRQFIETQFRRMLSSEVPKVDSCRPPTDLSVNYVLHAGIGAIVWWLENDQPATPEQLADWLNQFSVADISVSLGLNGNGADSH